MSDNCWRATRSGQHGNFAKTEYAMSAIHDLLDGFNVALRSMSNDEKDNACVAMTALCVMSLRTIIGVPATLDFLIELAEDVDNPNGHVIRQKRGN